MSIAAASAAAQVAALSGRDGDDGGDGFTLSEIINICLMCLSGPIGIVASIAWLCGGVLPGFGFVAAGSLFGSLTAFGGFFWLPRTGKVQLAVCLGSVAIIGLGLVCCALVHEPVSAQSAPIEITAPVSVEPIAD